MVKEQFVIFFGLCFVVQSDEIYLVDYKDFIRVLLTMLSGKIISYILVMQIKAFGTKKVCFSFFHLLKNLHHFFFFFASLFKLVYVVYIYTSTHIYKILGNVEIWRFG